MTKTLILDALAEPALLLPEKLAQGLAANDRLKLSLSLLQAAEDHARHPEHPLPDLTAELRGAGLDARLDLSGSQGEPGGAVHIPGSAGLRQRILEDIAAMLAPLKAAGAVQAGELCSRLQKLQSSLPPFVEDRVPAGVISTMTAIGRGGGDSLHRLVMDAHKALNDLGASLAEETLDGARVWRVKEEDRGLIRAFMAGVNETAPLKFDHPGLGTTATRLQNELLIQNDIGTTDAHVLVLRIAGLTASLTYTDIHPQRLRFFQSLFKPLPVSWTDTRPGRAEKLGQEGDYILTVGRFEAQDRRALERYLQFLGSRIVFLIDWNRARKRLRELLPKEEGIRLLKWAADSNVGHRGFLELGGEALVYEAMDLAQPAALRYGERLPEMLGVKATYEYLQLVFRDATAGLLQGRSERFIRDEIKAELARRIRTLDASLLDIALQHAERVFDIAVSVQDGLLRYLEPDAAKVLERTARRARRWEQESDAIVARVRSLARRTRRPDVYAGLLHEADDAADGLEEAAFLMTHLTTVPGSLKLVGLLQPLADVLVEAAQENVKMFAAASHVTRAGEREDLQDFFAAAERIVALEHEADEAERAVTSALLKNDLDARTIHLLSRLAGVLEQAADGLSLSAFKLRDHVLNEVMAG